MPRSGAPIASPMSSLTSTSTALPRIPRGPSARYRNDGAAATVRWPTRICPGSASCCTRAATLTASPVTITSPRRGVVVETTSPLLMPILTWSSGLPSASQLPVQLDETLPDPQRGAQGTRRVVLVGDRHAEDGHDGVADELLDGAATRLDLLSRDARSRRP